MTHNSNVYAIILISEQNVQVSDTTEAK